SGLVAECPGRGALAIWVDHQWSDSHAADRWLARAQARFCVKGRLKGDSQPLVALRSFVIRQLWKKFFRHGYRKYEFPPRRGPRPRADECTRRFTNRQLG